MIKVSLINSADGKTIAVSDMAAERLPDSFETGAILHLNGTQWHVDKAIPLKSEEYKSTGTLTLMVSKLEEVDMDQIHFSLPTITDTLPETSTTPDFTGISAQMHEDEWRQCEFLPEITPQVKYELLKINDIWEKESKKSGEITIFTRCHLRTLPQTDLNIDFNLIKALLPANAEFGSLKIGENWVENGFVLNTDNTLYYGLMKDNTVAVFCVDAINDSNRDEITYICASLGVSAVDWCKCLVIPQ